MKIAFISDQFFPRTSADSEQIISSLSALGKIATVTLISASHGDNLNLKRELNEYYQNEITFNLLQVTHRFRHIRGLEKLSFAIRSISQLKQNNYDLVFTRNIPVLISVLLFTNNQVLFESYRPWPDRNLLAKFFFKRLSNNKRLLGIVLHSKFAGNSFEAVGFESSKLLVAHNAFQLEQYEQRSKTEVLDFYGIPESKPILAYSDRVNKAKGVDKPFNLAEAFTNLTILIIGSEAESGIEKRANDFENIYIIEWLPQKDVYSLLICADILYIPPTTRARDISKNTVLPLKTFLYKATGKAIIAPNLEDIGEVLTHKVNSFLIEPDNSKAEGEGINTLLENEPLRKRIGKQAKIDMKELTWHKRVSLIHNFISNNLIKIK